MLFYFNWGKSDESHLEICHTVLCDFRIYYFIPSGVSEHYDLQQVFHQWQGIW